jgi:NAD(P)H dehydrogenase (quinone)
MNKPKILVTAAAGKTGAATTLLLLSRGFPVRALVRRADARSARLASQGAEVVVGSLEDWVDLRAALGGTQRAYFCPPLEPGTLRRAALFAAAAQEARLEAVVALSQWVVGPSHLAAHAREKWLSERVFQSMQGVGHVTVNPGWFADNYLAALEPIAQLGIMALPLGAGLNAPPSNQDIAKVIAGALANPAPHLGKTYRPTGPKLLSPEEIAATFAEVLGRPVKYQDAPLKLFLKVGRSLGLSDFVLTQLHSFLLDYQRNAFGVGAPTEAVMEVGGSPPEPFEATLRRAVVQSPLAKRSAGGFLRALLNVVRGVLTLAPNLAAIERGLGLPAVAHGTLAMDSADWRASHSTPEAPLHSHARSYR